jgi:anthranilate synthase component 1
LYRALRTINPSPYMFYLQFDDTTLIGASPEVLVTVEDGKAITRPIAGTRPRGKTPEDDAQLAQELLADPKERAEHIMLVDLGRNDIGRVSVYGTVRTTDLMVIERYSHVMHIVSEVQGQLRPDADAFDALRACFPAGTVSGAPKVRAMEIIDELEPTQRGPYAGAVGYFSYTHEMDACITIRTILVKDSIAHVPQQSARCAYGDCASARATGVGGAVEPRTMSSMGRYSCSGLGRTPLAHSSSFCTARAPSCSRGWRKVVSGGEASAADGGSSKPSTDTSSGTRKPA